MTDTTTTDTTTAEPPLDDTTSHEAILRCTVRMLPCRLTDEELLRLGGQLADALQDVATETERQASVKKELGARVARMQARVTELSARLRRREEEREVAVEIRADYAAKVAREIRTDTHAVILTRELTPAEQQRPLFNAAAPAESPRCLECGEAVETTAAEGCTNPECPDDRVLHPGCAAAHAEAHATEEDADEEAGGSDA